MACLFQSMFCGIGPLELQFPAQILASVFSPALWFLVWMRPDDRCLPAHWHPTGSKCIKGQRPRLFMGRGLPGKGGWFPCGILLRSAPGQGLTKLFYWSRHLSEFLGMKIIPSRSLVSSGCKDKSFFFCIFSTHRPCNVCTWKHLRSVTRVTFIITMAMYFPAQARGPKPNGWKYL